MVEGVDLTSLPLSPLEGFVLSRIDGAASVQMLADLTNLDEARVFEMTERLIRLGAAEWARESVSLPRATGRVATATPSGAIPVPPSLRSPARPPSAPARPPSGPARVRLRRESSTSVRKPPRAEGVYSERPESADEVDTSRRTNYPSSPPRASHTGSMRPPGELDEDPDEATPVEELPLPSMPPVELEGLEFDPPAQGTARSAMAPPSAPPDDAKPITGPAPRAPSGLRAPQGLSPERPPAVGSTARPPRSGAADRPFAVPRPGPIPRTASAPAAEETPEQPAAAEPSPPPRAPQAAASDGSPVASATPDPDPTPTPDPEELDIAADRRKRIDDLYYALELLDHYQVLGVPRMAPRKEIRTAYFQLSKVFHPDTMFRKKLGPYKMRMEAIFNRLTESYETLGRKKSRAEYDRYLGVQERTREVERTVDEEATEEVERERRGVIAAQLEADKAAGRPPSVETEVPEELRQPEPEPPSRPAPVTSQRTEAGKRRARELMAQKLRRAAGASGARSRPNVKPPAAESSPGDTAKRGRQAVLRDLTSSLKGTSQLTGGVDPIERHVAQARRAEEAGNLAEAAGHLRTAVLMAPDRPELEEEHRRVNAMLAKDLASDYEEKARYEQKNGKWAAAALSWAKVVEGRPDDAEAARCAARALVEARGDMHHAKELAQKAVDLDPDAVENLVVLARVYIAAGLELNARRVLERASKLDPRHEMVENLLRDLA